MQAGKLRHVITIQAQETSLGSLGQKALEWTNVRTNLRCAITAMSGSELERAKKLFASVTHRVTLRFDPALELTTKHRFVRGDRVLNIGFIDHVDELRRQWNVLVSEEL